MAISRVILNKNNTTTVLMNLQGDTATASDVLSGKTFHLANGTQATGTATDIVKLIDGTITNYSNDDNITLRDSAFQGCVYLTSVNLSELVNVPLNAFYGCVALETINLPSAKTLNNYCLANTNISSIELPSVETIKSYAFYYSENLEELILSGETMVTLENIDAFTGTKITASTGSIKVPASLVDTYKADAKWLTFASQIEAIA